MANVIKHGQDIELRRGRVETNEINGEGANSIELRNERGKAGASANKERNEKQNNDDDWRSSAVHGFGPVHQRSYLVTDPYAPKTPIVGILPSWQKQNNDNNDNEQTPLTRTAAEC